MKLAPAIAATAWLGLAASGLVTASMWTNTATAAGATAAGFKGWDPDTEPSRISGLMLGTLGPTPNLSGSRFGAVIKTYSNGYWRLIAAGYRRQAVKDGIKLDIQSTPNEMSPERQLAVFETMLGGFYRAILISPQLATNLEPGIQDAVASDVTIVDVDGEVSDRIDHFVGALDRDVGAKVAAWFVAHYPEGGKVAVIRGLPAIAVERRSAGFTEALERTGRFQVVAQPVADWDRRIAAQRAMETLAAHPDLIGFYCNNDVMAFGVMDALKASHQLDKIRVFGTDGTSEAYAAIAAGDMAGTVDTFPALKGSIGLRVAERLVAGQTVPRVVVTPTALITKANAQRYQVDLDQLEGLLQREAAP